MHQPLASVDKAGKLRKLHVIGKNYSVCFQSTLQKEKGKLEAKHNIQICYILLSHSHIASPDLK